MDIKFNQKTGIYNVSGAYLTDTWNFETYEVENQGFGLIDDIQNDEIFPFDGILGLFLKNLKKNI